MKKTALILICGLFLFAAENLSHAEIILEPFTYSEDFEAGEENAWASYPLWQDTAYDPLFKIGNIVPGDPNYSVDQTITPYTNVDNYAGAQKLLDMYLTPLSNIRLRFYIKSHLPAEFFQIHIAAGMLGKVKYTVFSPPTNRWEWLNVSFVDIIRQNPQLAGLDRLKVNALAVIAKIPAADPDMAFHFGVDDIVVKGARSVQFQYVEPEMFKLSEWKHYYPNRHYKRGEEFRLTGQWPLPADRVTLQIVSFVDNSQEFKNARLTKKGDIWSLKPFNISFPEGMYLGRLKALKKGGIVSESSFTFIVAPENIGGRHPRLLFDSKKLEVIRERIKTNKYAKVLEDIVSRAKKYREDNPLDTVIYDYDQLNDVDLIVDLGAWSNRIHPWGLGIEYNAFAYAFTGDREAADYAIGLMLKQSAFPTFSHPWMVKRGRHMYWQAQRADCFALGYDILYNIMDESQRKAIRDGITRNYLEGSFETFVKDNAVTNNTSNWIPAMAGRPLMSLAAIYGDDPDDSFMEPYMTGLIFKTYAHISKGVDWDGAYGEGFGYYNFSMETWVELLPSLVNVFNIDLSAPLRGSYMETIWAGIIKDKKIFYFGDSGSNLGPVPNFGWLVSKSGEPYLGWLYNFLKKGETLRDVLYDTENVPRDDPFDKNPVRLFRNVGTTVFKSGWEKDDFVFVMRTGAFYNHQHFDQGSFWLADHGSIFIEERHGSTYDNTPYYRPWYTKPVAHSTILIDGNHQSQRCGDPLDFAEGFHDHAFVDHFLDGEHAAFSSGNIGKLYWGEVKELKRNVLYLKPRTVLMLDTVVPAKREVDVNVLYQTTYLKDITAGTKTSTITKDGNVLNIMHLYPEHTDVKTVKTPHYYHTLRRTKPLIQEGMLTVNARTTMNPLVIANLLTATTGGPPPVAAEIGDGFVGGTAGNTPFAFTTTPGAVYETAGIATDALAVTWKGSSLFAAYCTTLKRNGMMLLDSEEPVTCEITPGNIKYYVSQECEVSIGVKSQPSAIIVSGKPLKNFRYEPERKSVSIKLPAGEGTVEVK